MENNWSCNDTYTMTTYDGSIYPTIETVSAVPIGAINTYYDLDLSDEKKEALLQELLKRCTARPTIEHKCHNCGAVLEIDENKHIFHCSYCDSVYAIGTSLINDRG